MTEGPHPEEALVDAAGTRHAPAGEDARIVSLVPSITELLFDLGLGEHVVGRTTFCVHPAPANEAVPRVGGTKTPKLERIREIAPTHVIVNVDENRIADVEAMRAFVPDVVVTHPLGPDDNLALYRLAGGLFGAAEAAQRLCRRFEEARARLAAAARDLPPCRVLYLVWREPWMTVSADTYIARTLALAGWETVGGDPDVRYPEVRFDRDLVERTGLVLLSSEPFPFKDKHVPEVRALCGGESAPPIAFIDGEMTSWYGSRAIAGLDYLADFARERAGASRR